MMLVYEKIEIDDNNGAVLLYLGEYVRTKISSSCDIEDEKKRILLNYPLVYVHTWINENDKQCIYVGETIDLVRRTKEHSEKVKERNTWQEDWIKGKNHVSYYFSAKEMSKSLVLDIENALINILGRSEDICLKNSRDNEQGRYCGKEFKNQLLKEIWNALMSDFIYLNKVNVSDYVVNSNDNNIYRQDISEPLIFFKKTKLWEKIEDIKEDICQNVCGCSELLLEWPVIYVHVWKNEEKHIRVYVGETIDIASRTLQHLNNDTINYDLDALIYHENEPNWHDSWKEAIKRGEAFMFVFGHEYMNVSVTRDIENHLIRYINFIKTSVNGRGNPQKMYWDRDKMHPLFQKIVRVLEEKCNNNPDLEKLFEDKKEKFCSLDDMKKQSMFMASPFMPLEGQQDKAKEQIMDRITARLTNDEGKKHNLLIVSGEAGTGKTVLASSIFFSLQENYSYIRTAFLVNHSELLNAYNVQNAVRETATGKTMNTIVSPAETVINDIKYSYLRSILQYFTMEEQKCIVSALSKDFETFINEINAIPYSKTFDNSNGLISLDQRNTIRWKNLKYLISQIKKYGLKICDPTYDVVLVDEAHLLKITGDGGGVKETQLPTILENSKVTILLTDAEQSTDSCEIWDEGICNNNLTDKYCSFLTDKVTNEDFSVESICDLTHQFRMNCGEKTKKWLKSLYTEGEEVKQFPFEDGTYEPEEKENLGEYYIYEKDDKGNVIYTIGIFESKWTLCRKIAEKKERKNPSGLLASFCWENRKCKNDDETRLFDIPLENGEIVRLRWHSTGDGATDDESKIWTMDKSLVSKKDNKLRVTYIDIGSFHDIQGFDLNYAGVILGKSLKLGKDNKIKYNCNEGGRRGISKNTPHWKKIIRNEIGVLLSRGIEGVYIYIDDDKLRRAVVNAIKHEK